MEQSNLKKSKKRKPRKSREDLSKKRRNVDDDNNSRGNKSCCIRSCNCITNNRLTLYNKVVRSETATRLQISKSEVNRIEINENNGMIRGKFRINVMPLKKDTEESESDIPDDNSNSVRKYKVQKLKTYCESSDSDISFHVGELDEDGINEALESPYRVSLISSTLSDDDDNELYRDFVDDIDKHIGKIAPEFLNLDFLEKMRAPFLTFSWQNHDVEKNNKNYTSKFNNELIKEHTLRYTTTNTFENSDHQTKANIQDISMGSPVSKKNPNSNDVHSSPSIASIVCDSPEHTYYPHKLN